MNYAIRKSHDSTSKNHAQSWPFHRHPPYRILDADCFIFSHDTVGLAHFALCVPVRGSILCFVCFSVYLLELPRHATKDKCHSTSLKNITPGCLLGGKLNWILISFPNGNNLTQTRQSLLSPPQTVAKGFYADFSHWGTKEDR